MIMQDTHSDARPTPSPSKRRRPQGLWIALALFIGGLIIMGAVVQASLSRTKAGGSGELPQPRAVEPAAAPSPAELSNSFRQVAKDVKPAVVNINIVEAVRRTPFFPGLGIPDDDGYGKQRGTGSGAIVTADGYIITNNHVVGKAEKIEVTLADGRKFKGERVGTDPETDIAVIKIDASALPTAVLGNSDSVEQGDWVLAIGSPFGLQQTITAGIISATGRDIPRASQFNRYLQTDASINPGNSGGPLVNMRGEVIGINTLIYSNSGGNEGVGFAIPSNLARRIYGELLQNGKMTRGYLGVGIRDLDSATADAIGLEVGAGVLVGDVRADGPAAKGGIKTGDVITAIDGNHVGTAAELTNTVSSTLVGKSVRVDYVREGKKLSTTVVLAERPPLERQANGEPGGGEARPSRLGLSVQTVTPALAEQLNLDIKSGAMVVRIRPGSSAAEVLNSGDVIHQVGRDRIQTADDLVRATESLKGGQEIALRIERSGSLLWVTISVD
ncbi:MAG: hypothetical protein DMF61_19180 [Blastocatellia bacterium AA13]|nr:MAG: hypothetical protein DMF61_19180 [Blastocatellia bacterium AA13]